MIVEWSPRANDGEGHWGETLSGGYYGLTMPDDVECWMPLPEPPEGK